MSPVEVAGLIPAPGDIILWALCDSPANGSPLLTVNEPPYNGDPSAYGNQLCSAVVQAERPSLCSPGISENRMLMSFGTTRPMWQMWPPSATTWLFLPTEAPANQYQYVITNPLMAPTFGNVMKSFNTGPVIVGESTTSPTTAASVVQKQLPVCSPGAKWWSGSRENGETYTTCKSWTIDVSPVSVVFNDRTSGVIGAVGTIGSSTRIMDYQIEGCGERHDFICSCQIRTASPTSPPTPPTGSPTPPTAVPSASPTNPTASPTRQPTIFVVPVTGNVALYSDGVNRVFDYVTNVGSGTYDERATVFCRDFVTYPTRCDAFGKFTLFDSRGYNDTMAMQFSSSIPVYSYNGTDYNQAIVGGIGSIYGNLFSPLAVLNFPASNWWSASDAQGNYQGNDCVRGNVTAINATYTGCAGTAAFVCACSIPTSSPTQSPTTAPSHSPSKSPTNPTRSPTRSPSRTPTLSPSSSPTRSPSGSPTPAPTFAPTIPPTPPVVCDYSLATCDVTGIVSESPSRSPTVSGRRALSNDKSLVKFNDLFRLRDELTRIARSERAKGTTHVRRRSLQVTGAPTDSPTLLTADNFDPFRDRPGVVFRLIDYTYWNETIADAYDVSFSTTDVPCLVAQNNLNALYVFNEPYVNVVKFTCANDFVMPPHSMVGFSSIDGDNAEYLRNVTVESDVSIVYLSNLTDVTRLTIPANVRPFGLLVLDNPRLQILTFEPSATVSGLAVYILNNQELRYVDASALSGIENPLLPFSILIFNVDGPNVMSVKFGDFFTDAALYLLFFNGMTIEGENVERITMGSLIANGTDDTFNLSAILLMNPPSKSERFLNSKPNCTQTYVCFGLCSEFMNDCTTDPSIPDHDYFWSCTRHVSERCASTEDGNYVYDSRCWIPDVTMYNFTISGINDWANLSRVDCVLDATAYVTVIDTLVIRDTTINSVTGIPRVTASRVFVTNATNLTAAFPQCNGSMNWATYQLECFVHAPTSSPTTRPTSSPTFPTPAPTFAPSKPPTAPLVCGAPSPACAVRVAGTHFPTVSPTRSPTRSPTPPVPGRRLSGTGDVTPPRRALQGAPTTSPSFTPTFLDPLTFDPTHDNDAVLFLLVSIPAYNNGTFYDVYSVSMTYYKPPCTTGHSDVLALVVEWQTYANVFNFFCDNSFVLSNTGDVAVFKNLEGSNMDYISRVNISGQFSFFTVDNVSEVTTLVIHPGIQSMLINVENDLGLELLTIETTQMWGGVFLTIDGNPQLRYVDISALARVTQPAPPLSMFEVFITGDSIMSVRFGDLSFAYPLYSVAGYNFFQVTGSSVERIRMTNFNVSWFSTFDNALVITYVTTPIDSERFVNSFPNCADEYPCTNRCDAFLNDCIASESIPDHDYFWSCTVPVPFRCLTDSSYVYDPTCWIPDVEMVNFTISGIHDWANLSKVDCVLDANWNVTVLDTLVIRDTTITSVKGIPRVTASRVIVTNATALTAIRPACIGTMTWSVYLAACVADTTSPTLAPSKSPTSKPTTASPTQPTRAPTNSPTAKPTLSTSSPTNSPTSKPTLPTSSPTKLPTIAPSKSPTKSPTAAPTKLPTTKPTFAPSANPTKKPTKSPTKSPTQKPTHSPTASPTPAFCTRRLMN